MHLGLNLLTLFQIKWVPLGRVSQLSVLRACILPCEKSLHHDFGAVGELDVLFSSEFHELFHEQGAAWEHSKTLIFSFCLPQCRTTALGMIWGEDDPGPTSLCLPFLGADCHAIGGGGESPTCNLASVELSGMGNASILLLPVGARRRGDTPPQFGHTYLKGMSVTLNWAVEWEKEQILTRVPWTLSVFTKIQQIF